MKILNFLVLLMFVVGCSAPGDECTGDDCDPVVIISTDVGINAADASAEPFCGDGNIDPDEVCDDGEQNGEVGSCRDDCAGIELCGNGAVDDGESCDGDVETSCTDLGFDAGEVTCKMCQIDITACQGSRELPSIVDNIALVSPDGRWALVQGSSLDLMTLDLIHHGERFSVNEDDFRPIENGWVRHDEENNRAFVGFFGVSGETDLGELAPFDGRSPFVDRPDGVELRTETGDGFQLIHVDQRGDVVTFDVPNNELAFFNADRTAAVYWDGGMKWIDLESQTVVDINSIDKTNSTRTHSVTEVVNAKHLLDLKTGESNFLTDSSGVEFSSAGRFLVRNEERDCATDETVTIFTNLETGESHTTACERMSGNGGYYFFTEDDRYVIGVLSRYQAPDWIEDLIVFDTVTWTRGYLPEMWAGRRFHFNGHNVLFHEFRRDPSKMLVMNLSELNPIVVGDHFDYGVVPFEDGWLRSDKTFNNGFGSKIDLIEADGTSVPVVTSEEWVRASPNRRTHVSETPEALYIVDTHERMLRLLVTGDQPQVRHVSNDWVFFTRRNGDPTLEMISVR